MGSLPLPCGRRVARAALLIALAGALCGAAPVPVIFDTDIGNDIDDVLALAMLHALESRGECRLLGVTLTNPAPSAAPFTHLVNRFYGQADLPVGVSAARRTEGAGRGYPDAVLRAVPGKWREGPQPVFPPAVKLLRRLLASSTEKVVIVQVGFSDNLAGLLASGPDEESPLDGAALVREKVALLSAMAGDFAGGRPEYNVRIDVPAARRVIEDWPAPVVLSGFEVGRALLYPARSIERHFGYAKWHPVVEAYRAFKKMPYDQPTWDLTAVLQAVRPEAGYFDLSAPGVVRVDGTGRTTFRPEASGTRRYLVLRPERADRVVEAMMLLASQPPAGGGAR
jgi:inosine-uridine nucleoside N-ribohydrolase